MLAFLFRPGSFVHVFTFQRLLGVRVQTEILHHQKSKISMNGRLCNLNPRCAACVRNDRGNMFPVLDVKLHPTHSLISPPHLTAGVLALLYFSRAGGRKLVKRHPRAHLEILETASSWRRGGSPPRLPETFPQGHWLTDKQARTAVGIPQSVQQLLQCPQANGCKKLLCSENFKYYSKNINEIDFQVSLWIDYLLKCSCLYLNIS